MLRLFHCQTIVFEGINYSKRAMIAIRIKYIDKFPDMWYLHHATTNQTFLCHGRVLPPQEEAFALKLTAPLPRFNLCYRCTLLYPHRPPQCMKGGSTLDSGTNRAFPPTSTPDTHCCTYEAPGLRHFCNSNRKCNRKQPPQQRRRERRF